MDTSCKSVIDAIQIAFPRSACILIAYLEILSKSYFLFSSTKICLRLRGLSHEVGVGRKQDSDTLGNEKDEKMQNLTAASLKIISVSQTVVRAPFLVLGMEARTTGAPLINGKIEQKREFSKAVVRRYPSCTTRLVRQRKCLRDTENNKPLKVIDYNQLAHLPGDRGGH